MMNFLRKHRYVIFLITIGGFLLGSIVGTGVSFFAASPQDAALVVNNKKISYSEYQQRYRTVLRALQNEPGLPPERLPAYARQETVSSLVRERVFLEEADNYGLEVGDEELAGFIQSDPQFQREGRFDQGLYEHIVTQSIRLPVDVFEKEVRNFVRMRKAERVLRTPVRLSQLEISRRQQWALQGKDISPNTQSVAGNLKALEDTLWQEQTQEVAREWQELVNARLTTKINLDRFERPAETAPAAPREPQTEPS